MPQPTAHDDNRRTFFGFAPQFKARQLKTRIVRSPIYNLCTDPFEFAHITSNTYYDWYFDHVYLLVPAQHLVARFLATFKEFPPRQKAASFTVDQVLAKLKEGIQGRV